MSEWARAHNHIRRTDGRRKAWAHGPWTEEERRLLGSIPDAEVAARIGRTETAVRQQRTKLGIPTAVDRRRKP